MVPNPISLVSRWKIFDNLRRSLVEPFTFILFVAGWLWLPGGPIYWTIVPLLLFLFPTILQFAFASGPRPVSAIAKAPWPRRSRAPATPRFVALLNLAFLPHQALLVLDAVIRSLIRRFITGERLLEWETAAEAESHTRKSHPGRPLPCTHALHRLRPGHDALLCLAPSRRAACCVAHPASLVHGHGVSPLGSTGRREPRGKLNAADRNLLLCHALRIWRYFHEFGVERHNLPHPRQRGRTRKSRSRSRFAHQHRLAAECPPGRHRIRIPHAA